MANCRNSVEKPDPTFPPPFRSLHCDLLTDSSWEGGYAIPGGRGTRQRDGIASRKFWAIGWRYHSKMDFLAHLQQMSLF